MTDRGDCSMRFYTLDEKKPEIGDKVLVKLREYEDEKYAVCDVRNKFFSAENGIVYCIAGGEEFAFYFAGEIAGWMSVNELDNIECGLNIDR